jgi:hypothetical protein
MMSVDEIYVGRTSPILCPHQLTHNSIDLRGSSARAGCILYIYRILASVVYSMDVKLNTLSL